MGRTKKVGNFLVRESTYEEMQKEIEDRRKFLDSVVEADLNRMKSQGLISDEDDCLNDKIEYSEESVKTTEQTDEEKEYNDKEHERRLELLFIEALEDIEKKLGRKI